MPRSAASKKWYVLCKNCNHNWLVLHVSFMKNILLLCFLFLAFAPSVEAQKTASFTSIDRIYREALDLFDKEKYAAAQRKFEEFIALKQDPLSERSVNAEYYAGLCAMNLYHKDAEYRLEQFVENHPASAWSKRAYFELAVHNYKRKSYRKAIDWFEKSNPRDLQPEERDSYNFKRGHAHFEQDQFADARQFLQPVKDGNSEFQRPALYYYSHIVYSEGQFETALNGFKQLENDPNFAPIAPYYITQILYKQGRYDEVLEYAPKLIDSTSTVGVKRLPEISRLVGDAHYRRSNYAEALPYIERYHAEVPKKERSREDFFQLAYCYYQTGEFAKALSQFSEATNEDDELAQTATYYMGDCYLRLDQKPYARTAFKEASEKDFNREIKEDALFNYARLAFELSYNPFHEAITAFETYLERYPDSPRREEAYEFLLNVYMRTRAYEKALNSLDKIVNKDARTKEAYQIVAFNRGVELFQSQQYASAESFFDKVAIYPINASFTAEALFWKAELAYRNKEYSKAAGLYNAFLKEPGAYTSEFYNEANYGTGYSLFNQEKYVSSLTAFRKFIDQFKGDDLKKKGDALLRIADSYYVTKDYGQAIAYYDQAIVLNQQMTDYALYQKSLCHGLNGDTQKKIQGLTALIENEVDSRYTVDSKYELAKTYLQRDQLNEARKWYEIILREHPNSAYIKYSLLDMCLIFVKTGENNRVVEFWNRIKTEYPNDRVTIDAYNLVETVLLEEGLMDQLPDNLGLSNSDIEGKVYSAAADFAISGDCDKAIPRLEEYLRKYQPALYGTAANYYLANCFFGKGQMDDALNGFNFVLSQPTSDFSEQSLVTAATINYNNKNYPQALNHYIELEGIARTDRNLLEAQIGQMRCYYLLNQKDYALEYSEKVIANPNTPSDILPVAHLWKGRMLKENGNLDDAYNNFSEVIKSGGVRAAEAKYNMAEIAYLKKAYKPAETEIFQLVEKYSAFDEWKFKGFLLLADVYVGLSDYFQARTTLTTIIANVSTPWVVEGAQSRLESLDRLEAGESDSEKRREIEIDLNPGN